MRPQRPVPEQEGIRQETGQEEVTGEVEAARAAALLQPAAECSRQGISFCFLVSPEE